MERALVLLSGGLDSAVALWWAMREGHEVVALTFRYPGRPRREAEAAQTLAARAGVEHVETDLPFLVEAQDADPTRFARAPPGYVPARNALFYAAATHVAEARGCALVVGGHNGEDAARFPDASPRFFAELQRLLHRGLVPAREGPLPRLVMPLHELSRTDVARLGAALGAPLDATWSCYEDVDLPCGECPACASRRTLNDAAFA